MSRRSWSGSRMGDASVGERGPLGGEGRFSVVDDSSKSLDSLIEVDLSSRRGYGTTGFGGSVNHSSRGRRSRRSRTWRVGGFVFVCRRVCLRGCWGEITIGEDKGDWREGRVVEEVLFDVAVEAREFHF